MKVKVHTLFIGAVDRSGIQAKPYPAGIHDIDDELLAQDFIKAGLCERYSEVVEAAKAAKALFTDKPMENKAKHWKQKK